MRNLETILNSICYKITISPTKIQWHPLVINDSDCKRVYMSSLEPLKLFSLKMDERSANSVLKLIGITKFKVHLQI